METCMCSSLTQLVKGEAAKIGLDDLGVARADPFDGYAIAGSRRRDPRLTLPEARSLIVVGVYIGAFVLPGWEDRTIGRTSRLFLSGYYADVVEPLKHIATLLQSHGFQAQICDSYASDTSSIPLKLGAVRAGMGWQGKNSLLVSRRYGSFLALGGVITDAPLEPDPGPGDDLCRKCTACIDACPTKALSPYRLDRRMCLSDLLDQGGPLTADVMRATGNQVVECDICQEACPWNSNHLREPLRTERGVAFRNRIRELQAAFKLDNLASLTPDQYASFMEPYRIPLPYATFRRNVIAALARSGLPHAKEIVRAAMQDADEAVSQTARLAHSMLLS
ncbi:MAG: 4Fe-4S double cluster binding domain-containing protein [Bacillota bacterium]